MEGTIKFISLKHPLFALCITKKVREKSRECHNHKPQPFPDPQEEEETYPIRNTARKKR